MVSQRKQRTICDSSGATANTVIGYASAQESPVAYKVVASYGALSLESDVSVITVPPLIT
jgi:hypothetical protein